MNEYWKSLINRLQVKRYPNLSGQNNAEIAITILEVLVEISESLLEIADHLGGIREDLRVRK